MKDKKNIILIAVLVVAAAAIAAVVVFSARMNKRDAGEDNTTEETTTAEPETTEPETPEETTAVPDDPEPYEPEGTPYVIDENNQVLYGWYPCTLMQNGIKGLEAAEYDDNNTAVIDGTRYMRVQNGDGYDYYRFEMIKWNVIAESGDAYTLLASSAVDCMPYNDAFAAASWEKSSLSAWLNGYFYDTAFSEEEKKGIVPTELGANRNPIYNNVTGEYLKTNVYLLSAENLLDPACGFDVYVQTDDAARVCGQTPFAQARGVYVYSDGYCKWWTRTNGVEASYAVFVNSNGVIGCDGIFVNSDGIGVRPALRVSKETVHKAETESR